MEINTITRALVFKENDSLKIVNRRELEISFRYPELLDIKRRIRARSAVLDGEIIVFDESGKRPDFFRLAEREHTSSEVRIKLLSELMPATFVVFDILWVDGKDLTQTPLLERKKVLKEVVEKNGRIEICFFTEEGKKLYEVAKKMKLEGVMAKVKDSLYYCGKRRREWLKIKFLKTIDCVICGFTEGEGWRKDYFGALVLGVFDGGKLRYVGRVGTGLTEKGYAELTQLLKKMEVEKNPFDIFEEEPSIEEKIHWVKPNLVCEVKFMEITEDKKLRAPSFVRLRYDKKIEDCILES